MATKKWTKAQLKKLGENELQELAMIEFGLVPGDDWGADRMISEILEAATVAHENELEQTASASSGRRVRVRIANGDGVNGKSEVFFGHNGRQYLAKRNVPIELPEEVLSALNDAVVTTFEDETDDEGKVIKRVPRDVPRYNIQILGYVE